MSEEPNVQARIRVVIVDDHRVVRDGIRAFLETERDLEVVGEAGSAEEAARVCERLKPDVAVVDLVMPGGGALAVSQIVKLSPNTQVLILTSFEEPKLLLDAVRAGALCCLLKDIEPSELARAIRRASEGEATVHPRIAKHLVAAVRQPEERSALENLSTREREVLALIAQGLSNAQIGERLSIGEKTVKTHVSNVLAKLEINDRTQAAVLAWKRGWVKS